MARIAQKPIAPGGRRFATPSGSLDAAQGGGSHARPRPAVVRKLALLLPVALPANCDARDLLGCDRTRLFVLALLRVVQGITSNGRIMSLSSCSTMWQWYTYVCGAVTPSGSSNFVRMVVYWPGLALTVSLKPRSSGSGGSIGPVANGLGSTPPGTPPGVPYFAS